MVRVENPCQSKFLLPKSSISKPDSTLFLATFRAEQTVFSTLTIPSSYFKGQVFYNGLTYYAKILLWPVPFQNPRTSPSLFSKGLHLWRLVFVICIWQKLLDYVVNKLQGSVNLEFEAKAYKGKHNCLLRCRTQEVTCQPPSILFTSMFRRQSTQEKSQKPILS